MAAGKRLRRNHWNRWNNQEFSKDYGPWLFHNCDSRLRGWRHRLRARGNGPHPYDIGAEWVQRYFQVMQGCARAAQLRLEQTAVGSGTAKSGANN